MTVYSNSLTVSQRSAHPRRCVRTCLCSANGMVARKPSFSHQTTVDSTSTDILEYNSRFLLLCSITVFEHSVVVTLLCCYLICVDKSIYQFVTVLEGYWGKVKVNRTQSASLYRRCASYLGGIHLRFWFWVGYVFMPSITDGSLGRPNFFYNLLYFEQYLNNIKA